MCRNGQCGFPEQKPKAMTPGSKKWTHIKEQEEELHHASTDVVNVAIALVRFASAMLVRLAVPIVIVPRHVNWYQVVAGSK